jgi:histidinol-phosphate aminotransferase
MRRGADIQPETGEASQAQRRGGSGSLRGFRRGKCDGSREIPHVIVARTFSKAYSLCFQRVGYFVGHPELIAALDKIRDSYNVNGLGQVAALATLDDLQHYRANFKKIIATRERLSRELAALGFTVLPSQTNFILARPPRFQAKDWLGKLRARKIMVRWFKQPSVRDYLRITIGTDSEADALLRAAKSLCRLR